MKYPLIPSTLAKGDMAHENTLTPETSVKTSIEHYGKTIMYVVCGVFTVLMGAQNYLESKELRTSEKFSNIDKKFVAIDASLAEANAYRSSQAVIDKNLMDLIADLKNALKESDRKSDERNKETNMILNRILLQSKGIK
jgi:hypothetical protein